MELYPKIQTVFLRDPKTNYKTMIEGKFALPEFAYLANNEWIFTEKVDGTNIRVMFEKGVLSFGGRTERAVIPRRLLKALENIFSPRRERLIEMFGDSKVCLYGEGYGAKIQKGEKYRPDQGFVLFDIKVGDHWLKRKNIEDIASKLGIEIVPVVGRGTLADMVKIVKKGFVSAWGDFLAEGIVARPAIELFTRTERRIANGKRIITKLKYKDFKRE